ncbi:hypothetical protein M407DRAFT_18720 [Tulasnella calospora MUT 4182]|uniref:Uncharacterized protein n=1 Tax=Tulasnella calospora MUT 4182 TaxID=1051891 RepID=A0A0C3QJF8_9AGAM|nr:hypothetical protein M407DRAFT_18720 [Tulasnella calospora MUT 4182]
MSQGLFQWAQIAVEYISGGSPKLRLEELLESPSLFDGLDSMYAQILSKAYETAKKRRGRGELLLHLLRTLEAAQYPVSPEIFTYLSSDRLMFRNKSQQQSIQLLRLEIACDIGSLLYIPGSPRQPMRLVHTSVRDLLVDQGRCGAEPYFIDLSREHRNLATQCFELMEQDLQPNICGLSDLSESNSEVQDVVEHKVSKGLQYCCRSWLKHLVGGDWSSEMAGALLEAALNNLMRLSKTELLCWLEIMSLVEATLEALEMEKQACAWLQASDQRNQATK